MYRKTEEKMFGSRTKLYPRRKPRQELSEDQKRELVEAFELFDTNKSGSIDYYEMKV